MAGLFGWGSSTALLNSIHAELRKQSDILARLADLQVKTVQELIALNVKSRVNGERLHDVSVTVDSLCVAVAQIQRELQPLLPGFIELNSAVQELLRQFIEHVRPPKPGAPTLVVTSEKMGELGMDLLQFHCQLVPVAQPSDVVRREVRLVVNGEVVIEQEFALDADRTPTLEAPEGALIRASVVDTDNAGNQSPPAEVSGVLVDTIPPPQPNIMGFVVTGERTVEDETTAPPEEETTAPPEEETTAPPEEETPTTVPPPELL